MPKSRPSSSKIDRKRTDDSLSTERDKTDDSFKTGRGSLFVNTDKVLRDERLAADNKRIDRRLTADHSRLAHRDQSLSAGQLNIERQSALIDQRKLEDIAIANERSQMDIALQHERDAKEILMHRLFDQERASTDENLLVEREKTDSNSARSQGLLTAEQTEHLKTKSILSNREDLVAVVSHDLRNPIAAILSASEILFEELGPDVAESAAEMVALIRRNAEISLRLISDLLDMERIVDGKIKIETKQESLSKLIHEQIEAYGHLANAKNISLASQLPSVATLIRFDQDRIAQVVSNLIGNALKFTPAYGAVSIKLSEAEDEVVVSVTDTGPGIQSSQRERIFERFAQIKNKDRTGLGLGLYIAKTLVESHLGKLWVSSEMGQGSVFSFSLPK